ncbi:Ribonuclease H1 [Stylosanthes scabra]|uniref:Ribonuclease H1 n=1 Tax=Stylosanthes scabra TaxID=79078 RepID=A0ABU6UGV4_9FABA|nr:Ribonuclease H1 [Stylosanthes scabra]
MTEGKYSHYAVRVGNVRGVYTSWEECVPYVLGVSGAQFKGFKSLEEALVYMHGGSAAKGKNIVSTPTMKEKLSPAKAKVGEPSSKMLATQPEASFDGGSVDSGTYAESQYVDETQGGGFVIVEDMELYLWRACRKLGLGCPVFDKKLFYDVSGQLMFGFSTAVRCEEKGLAIESDGSFMADEFMAREDDAFKLLDELLKRKGAEVCDFNFRRNCALRVEGREDRESRESMLQQRRLDVERDCARLRHEIETYQKHLGLWRQP